MQKTSNLDQVCKSIGTWYLFIDLCPQQFQALLSVTLGFQQPWEHAYLQAFPSNQATPLQTFWTMALTDGTEFLPQPPVPSLPTTCGAQD